jgi:hypothetical protein
MIPSICVDTALSDDFVAFLLQSPDFERKFDFEGVMKMVKWGRLCCACGLHRPDEEGTHRATNIGFVPSFLLGTTEIATF